MSFLSLIGGNRRNPTPPQPTAPTASTQAVHAQMSLPSRQGTVDSSAPTAHDKRRPSRRQTDPASSSTQPPRPSRSLTVNGNKRLLSPPPPSNTGVSPSVSEISLVETLEDETVLKPPKSVAHPSSGVSTTSLSFPKPSTSLEQEWTEIETDSSDEDGFISAYNDDSEAPNVSQNRQNSSKPLNESGVLVDDDLVKAQRLSKELSTTQKTLSEMRKQNSMLQQRLKGLEQESKLKASQLKLLRAMEETNDVDKVKTSREHTTAMEAKQRDIRDLQNSIEILQRESKAWEEKVEMLVRENEVLRNEVAGLEGQNKRDEEELEGMKKEVDAANTALRTFRDRSRAMIGLERRENKKLKERADDLWRELESLKKHSKERDEQLHDLQVSSESTGNAFHAAEATAQEKDRALNEAQCQVEALERERDALHHKAVEMETEVVEARNTAQRLLARANEDQKHESDLANERIRSLEKELYSYSTSIQQFRTSLKTSRADAENAAKLSESRTLEIESLQQQVSVLEEELHSKEQDLIDANAGHASQSHLEDKIAKLTKTIEQLKSDHTVECHHLDLQATKERARVSKLETEVSDSRERIRELRSRLEQSDQSRRMLRDQLARREEESHNGRPESASSSSTTNGSNLTSSIIHDPAQSPNDQLFNLLRNLNYEIFQTSALLADSLCTIPRPNTTNATTITNSDLIDQETSSLLGPLLLSLLRSQSTTPLDSYDSYPLQTAIQATFICCATRIMTAWYPGHWDHSDFLAATYIRIREAEGIAASDTWRAMTRARLRPTTTTVVRVVDFLEECLDTIFRYAGWPAVNTAKSSSSGGGSKSVEGLLKDNCEKLSALARHSLRLNVLLDGVTPQLEPAIVEPGSVFDPYVMDRDDDGSRADEDDEVISTSEIGLRKVAVESKASDPSSSTSHRRRIVLKPKVILKSTFDA